MRQIYLQEVYIRVHKSCAEHVPKMPLHCRVCCWCTIQVSLSRLVYPSPVTMSVNNGRLLIALKRVSLKLMFFLEIQNVSYLKIGSLQI
jgi:hypothetical protein